MQVEELNKQHSTLSKWQLDLQSRMQVAIGGCFCIVWND